MAKPPIWEHVAYVWSDSQPGKEYEVKRHRTTGALGCSCPAYRFVKGEKTCKHIEAYARVNFTRDSTPLKCPRPSVSVGGETFTIRRAITFGEMPT
jgi:hypothetical protein